MGIMNFDTYKEMFKGYDIVERKLNTFPEFQDSTLIKLKLNENDLNLEFALYEFDNIVRFTFKNVQIKYIDLIVTSPNMEENSISGFNVDSIDSTILFTVQDTEFKEILKFSFTDASIQLLDDNKRKERSFIGAVFKNLSKLR